MKQNNDIRAAAFLFSAVVVFELLLGACYNLIVRPSLHYLIADAKDTATYWSEVLAPKLKALDDGAAADNPAVQHVRFDEAKTVSRVFGIVVFDRYGRVRIASNDKLAANTVFDVGVARVAESRKPRIKLKSGNQPGDPERYAEAYIPLLDDGEPIGVAEIFIDQTKTFQMFWHAILYAAGGVTLVCLVCVLVPGIAFFVSSRQKYKAHKQIAFMSQHDGMTQLLTRTAFLSLLADHVKDKPDSDKSFALLTIDIDRFKLINDTYGHQVGDEIIVEVAQRLKNVMERKDLVGRFGADEFVIAQMDIARLQEASALGRRLIEAVAKPITIGGMTHRVTISVGISQSLTYRDQLEVLLQQSDLALSRAKEDGGNRRRFFTRDMDVELRARLVMEEAIRNAAFEETFELHFQPLFDANNYSLVSFEGLLRLPCPKGISISPAVFVPIAEKMGLITEIGKWTLNHACSVAVTWPRDTKIAVNLSPLQFADGKLVASVCEALERSGLEAERLELEITEGLLLSNTDSILKQLRALKEIGVSIVMDDFGTGYSSLSYLWQFPFDKVKIDRSFLTGLSQGDKTLESVLRTVGSLCRSLNMNVTVEGVETAEQAAFLRELECDQVQGYFFGRPMPERDVASFILRNMGNSEKRLGKPAKPALTVVASRKG